MGDVDGNAGLAGPTVRVGKDALSGEKLLDFKQLAAAAMLLTFQPLTPTSYSLIGLIMIPPTHSPFPNASLIASARAPFPSLPTGIPVT